MIQSTHIPFPSFGWCAKCQREHRLPTGNAPRYAQELMKEIEDIKRIDYLSDTADADPRFSTDYLFGEARGQMFGVLECEDSQGATVVLRAFSCQYNSVVSLAGWAPPVFDVDTYERVTEDGDSLIREVTRKIENAGDDEEKIRKLKSERRSLSQVAIKDLQRLYKLTNFAGDTLPVSEFFKAMKGAPAGAGDCCAPKLLNHAARNNLRPVGIAEFYWGKTNRSGTREHGRFYASCESKCQPILGFLLCGAGL